MLLSPEIWIAVAGTIVLWLLSGGTAIGLGLVFAAGSVSSHRWIWLAARAGVNFTRGVPTSIFVIAAGLGMMRLAQAPELPAVFPGTPAVFQHVAWGVAFALALGSAGHFAEIFRASRAALGRERLDEATVLGLSRLDRTILLARECAVIALPPTGARLVHHLHNTAFAALFPVMDLFGMVQGQVAATFQVFHYAALGCAIYVSLSGFTWLIVRGAEAALAPPAAALPKRAGIGT
jgi:ABC-type arginine/histidine transport system permease subunit